MGHHAGIDVSLEMSSVCVVDAAGKLIKEGKVESTPEALIRFLASLDQPVERVGLEAGPLSQWLRAGLVAEGYDAVLLETRHVKAALSAMAVKTDRKDARGIAQLLRMGWFRPVHAKSPGSQELRAILVARKLLLNKLVDVEVSLRGILRGFGLKLGKVTRRDYEARIRELADGHPTLIQIADAMLSARLVLLREVDRLHRSILAAVRDDDVCRRFMTAPGVGPITSIAFKTAIDDPRRFSRSRSVGASFGLTPRKYQSGEKEVTGGVTRAGDGMVRNLLYEAATVLLGRVGRNSALKRWATAVARRRGMKRARVAVARKLAVILHRMWLDETDFRWSAGEAAAG
jgi:transposase